MTSRDPEKSSSGYETYRPGGLDRELLEYRIVRHYRREMGPRRRLERVREEYPLPGTNYTYREVLSVLKIFYLPWHMAGEIPEDEPTAVSVSYGSEYQFTYRQVTTELAAQEAANSLRDLDPKNTIKKSLEDFRHDQDLESDDEP